MSARAVPASQSQSVTPSDPPRARLTSAQRREKFLDAAAALITDSGIESVTMERVAAASGVSKALGYGYFTNSDELLAAVFQRETRQLDERVLAQMAGVTDVRERMRRMLEAVFETVSQKGALLGRLFLTQRVGGALEQARRERQQFLEGYFIQMMVQEAGVSERRAAVAVPLLLAAVNGTIESWAARRTPIDDVVDVFARMVAGSIDAMLAE